MARFPIMYVGDVRCETAREYAAAANCALRTAYAHAARRGAPPKTPGPKARLVDIEFEGGRYATVRDARERTGKSETTVRRHAKPWTGAVPPLPEGKGA